MRSGRGTTLFKSDEIPDLVIRNVQYPEGCRQPTHAHDCATVTLVLGGVIREHVGGEVHVAGPASLVVKPAGTPHENRFAEGGARTLQVRLPRNLNRATDRLVELPKYGWRHGDSSATAALRLFRELTACRPCALSVSDRLVELFDTFYTARSLAEARAEPRWLSRVVDCLEAGYRAPISASELATEARVHPVYLARAFRRHRGCSVSEYLKQRRVRESCRQLADTDLAFAAIAHDVGFSDQPHFCRVFKEQTGFTPRAYRSAVQGDRGER